MAAKNKALQNVVYLKTSAAYAIIPVGKNDVRVHWTQRKAPELPLRGLSLCRFGQGGLLPGLATSYYSPSSHLHRK